MRSLCCLAFLTAAIILAQERQPGGGVNFYSKEKEAALGRRLAVEFRQTVTPVDNPIVSEYLQHLTANLAAQFPSGWTYQVEVIREATRS